MPSRFFDYESDLARANKNESKTKTGFRRRKDSDKSTRSCSTSGPASTSTTRSSLRSSISSNGHGSASSSRHTGHYGSRSDGVLISGSHNLRDPRREEQVEPTEAIQAWAHQMHIRQQRQYWWCSSCYPKAPELRIPTDKAMKRVRIVEPTHAYE